MSKKAAKTGISAAMIEALESRRMLSASLAKGVLRVSGDSADNVIRIQKSGTSIQAVIDGVTQTFKAGAVKRIRAMAGAGEDSVLVGPAIPSNISGGPGNDQLTGGKAADSINGGDGDDVVNGRGGDDTLLGDGGGDTINGLAGNDSILGGQGRDNLGGGAGNDLLNGEAGTDSISGGGGTDLSIDLDDRLTDPDQADADLNVFFGAFPGLFNDLFPNGTGGSGGGINDILGGGGGSIFGGGGSIFG
jgi:Ca2+-binding RTX toxin-like protein